MNSDLISRSRLKKRLEGILEMVVNEPIKTYANAIRSAISEVKMAPAVNDEPANTKWISVKERLPKKYAEADGTLINYLVYMPEYGVDVGSYIAHAKSWICMGLPAKVTHWMPLPEPPEVARHD